MSKLDELIKELCPDGVEYKTLDEIVSFRRGSFPQPYGKSEWYGGIGAMPFVQVADVADNGFCLNEQTKQTISTFAQPLSIFVPNGTVLVTLQGTIGRVAITQYDSYVDRTLAIFNNYKININKKYFAYQLKAKFDIEKINARGSTLKTITKEEFSKFEIPLPPLQVQREIVRILDNFTELTAELTTELTARKKQYEYYRDNLLTFGDDVEYKKLKDVYIRIKGTPITAGKMKDIENPDGSIRIFAGGKTVINAFEKDIPKANITRVPAVLVQSRGIIDAVYYEEPFTFKNEMWAYTSKQKISVKYLYYVLKNNIQQFRDAASGMGSMPQISLKVTDDFLIPVPPLEVQKRIVQILDRFDSLCNDISSGIPAEIAARQKQYEYYRDRLLTFKELS